MSKIRWKVDSTGCWVCTSHKPNRDGYYEVTRCGKHQLIHRLVHELFSGKPLTSEMVVRHTCDNPMCINPDHLIDGTHADNVRDRVSRGRTARGINNGRAKLRLETIRHIIEHELHMADADLAKKYNVTRRVFYDIRRGKTWRQISHLVPDRFKVDGNKRRTERALARQHGTQLSMEA